MDWMRLHGMVPPWRFIFLGGNVMMTRAGGKAMAKYRVAHVREQGQDMIIIPLEPKFGRASEREQEATVAELQACARSAGLKGTVVPVWTEGGRMRFRAPKPWHPFFRSLTPEAVEASINRELTCQ